MANITITDDMLKGLEDKVILITGRFDLNVQYQRKSHTLQVDPLESAAQLHSCASTWARTSWLEISILPTPNSRRTTD